jgi:hypothetical protein
MELGLNKLTGNFRSAQQEYGRRRSCKALRLATSNAGASGNIEYKRITTDIRGSIMSCFRLLCCAVIFASLGLAQAQSQHDQSVQAEIQRQLDDAFRLPGEIAVSTRIQSALEKVTAKRNEKGMSTDEVLRDAEYYLHGLYGASARDWSHIGPTLGAPVYNAFKWAALRCRDAGFPELEKKMRTQPDNPVSEPGGTDWAYRGLKDGISIDGKKKVGPKPTSAGHGLKLTALDTATTCVST